MAPPSLLSPATQPLPSHTFATEPTHMTQPNHPAQLTHLQVAVVRQVELRQLRAPPVRNAQRTERHAEIGGTAGLPHEVGHV